MPSTQVMKSYWWLLHVPESHQGNQQKLSHYSTSGIRFLKHSAEKSVFHYVSWWHLLLVYQEWFRKACNPKSATIYMPLLKEKGGLFHCPLLQTFNNILHTAPRVGKSFPVPPRSQEEAACLLPEQVQDDSTACTWDTVSGASNIWVDIRLHPYVRTALEIVSYGIITQKGILNIK